MTDIPRMSAPPTIIRVRLMTRVGLEGSRKRIQPSNKAQRMIRTAQSDNHPYLTSKGFPEFRGLVANDLLLIPMWTMNGREIRAVQTIEAPGGKEIRPERLHGCKHGPFRRRQGDMWWWVEGYATALSVYEALKRLYRTNDRVVVAFSAGGIAKYAKHGLIVAEPDRYVCNIQECHHRWAAPWGDTVLPEMRIGTDIPPGGGNGLHGRRICPFWKSPMVGEDANDFWLREGTEALADALRDLLIGSR